MGEWAAEGLRWLEVWMEEISRDFLLYVCVVICLLTSDIFSWKTVSPLQYQHYHSTIIYSNFTIIDTTHSAASSETYDRFAGGIAKLASTKK